jgi:hypothetical protein
VTPLPDKATEILSALWAAEVEDATAEAHMASLPHLALEARTSAYREIRLRRQELQSLLERCAREIARGEHDPQR